MSRLIIITVFIHVLVLSFVWVGFPVPLPREGVEFYYSGSFMPEAVSGPPAMEKKAGGEPVLKTMEAGFFAPWIQARDLDKPRKP